MASKNYARLIPIIILIVALGLFFYFRLYRYLSFESLRNHRQVLANWTKQYYPAAVIIFMLIYIVAVAISIPGAVILTLIGGFLFGFWLGSLYVILSATIGATILYLAARFAFAKLLKEKAGKWVNKMRQGFANNAFSYLLFLRFVPIFPFWLVNIVPAILDVKLSTFFLATLFGIIPGTCVFVSVGNGLSRVFSLGEEPNLGIIFQPSILIPLVALGLISLVPIAYKKFFQKRTSS